MNYSALLRLVIIFAFMLLLVKTVDMVIIASTNSPDGILVTETQAAAAKPAEAAAPAPDAKPVDAAKTEEKPAEKSKPKKGEAPSVDATEKPVSYDEVKTYSDAELEVLERLSERRERLLKWEKDLQVKDNVLKITEEKIDTKLDELRKLKKDVEVSLAEYRKEEDAKTKSLVKVYESMKPKNAADIFSKMKSDDIVQLLGKMKEKSAAEILAKMDPNIAKDVTTKLNAIGKIKSSQPTNQQQAQQ